MATFTGPNALRDIAARIPTRIETVKKWAAFEAWRRITLKNPVDTGRSRGAWNMAIGGADLSVPPPVPPGQHLAFPSTPVIGRAAPGVPIVVSNNVDYIGALEAGHSQQAPAGFVRISVLEVSDALAPFAERIRREDEARP